MLIFEEMVKDLPRAFQRLLTFVGVDPSSAPRNLDIAYNMTGESRSRTLDGVLRLASRIGRLARGMVSNETYRAFRIRRDRFASANLKSVKEPLSADFRRRLLAQFEDDIQRTEALLGKDLSLWRKPRGDGN